MNLAKIFSRTTVAVGLTAGLALGTADLAFANRSASTSGASVSATGWYKYGVHSRGTVTDTKADGHCAYAQVKLALSGYNDYQWTKATACGSGSSKSWDNTGLLADVGPILSAFSSGVIQGVYVRACVDNHTWPLSDTCSGWAKIGDYGSSSAL